MKEKIDLSNCEIIDLLDHLPKYYREIEQMISLQKTLSIEVSHLKCIELEYFYQHFIETATWGLDCFEKDLDLEQNSTLTYEERRAIIKAKLMAKGATTLEKVTKIVKNFYENSEVREKNEEYLLKIKIVAEDGLPFRIKTIKNALYLVIPAHIALEFLIILMLKNLKMRLASVVLDGEETTIRPYMITSMVFDPKLRLGIGSFFVEETRLFPKEIFGNFKQTFDTGLHLDDGYILDSG